jgi:histone H4
MGTVQYDMVCWAPKEYTPGEDIDTSGQQASHYSGAPGRKKGARGKASEDTTSEGEAGRAPQSGFVWDEASGYYYDAASGFYYDGHRGLYYDGNTAVWCKMSTAAPATGRGKGGKGLGKSGAKRHRKVLRDNIQGITKPAIRRLARRGGVKRISGLIYEETRGVLKIFLEHVIRDAVTYTEHARRKTVTAMDVVYALKRQGRTLYGFGG